MGLLSNGKGGTVTPPAALRSLLEEPAVLGLRERCWCPSLWTRLQTQHLQRTPLLQQHLSALPEGVSVPALRTEVPQRPAPRDPWARAGTREALLGTRLPGMSASRRLRGRRTPAVPACEEGNDSVSLPPTPGTP